MYLKPNILSPKSLLSSKASGTKITNLHGDIIGRIEDFMLDLIDGTISFALASFCCSPASVDKPVVIPLEALIFDIKNEGEIILDIDNDTIINAPHFEMAEWLLCNPQEFIKSVYNYYGYELFRD